MRAVAAVAFSLRCMGIFAMDSGTSMQDAWRYRSSLTPAQSDFWGRAPKGRAFRNSATSGRGGRLGLKVSLWFGNRFVDQGQDILMRQPRAMGGVGNGISGPSPSAAAAPSRLWWWATSTDPRQKGCCSVSEFLISGLDAQVERRIERPGQVEAASLQVKGFSGGPEASESLGAAHIGSL